MALVAYTSSDEASSDEEDSVGQLNSTRNKEIKPTGTFLSSLPPPKTGSAPSILTALAGLPPPKNHSKQTPRDEVRQEVAISTKKKKNAVKITLPDLPDVDSDEEDEPSKKRPRATGLSGLMSMLPKPKQAVTKETNRALIPHTLTRKPPAQKPLAQKPSVASFKKPITSLVDADDSDDDDDGAESVNFFSLGDKPADKKKSTTSLDSGHLAQNPNKHTANILPVLSPNSQTSITPANAETGIVNEIQQGSDISASIEESSLVQSGHPVGENEPLAFSSGSSEHYMADADAPLTFKGGKTSQMLATSHSQYSDIYSGYQPQYDYGPQPSDQVSYTDDSQQDLNQYLLDEQFLRIQGKKHRGKEAINIIDVNAADQMATEIQMTKGISEDLPSMPRQKKKDDLPSSQQKRKHQITYLAHQAQEREFELRNQWASNAASKKQTQAKYGF